MRVRITHPDGVDPLAPVSSLAMVLAPVQVASWTEGGRRCYECELASATCTEKPAQDGVSQHCCVDSTCRQCISTCTLVLHAHASVQTTITLSSLGRSSSVWLAANSCTAASICAPVGAAVLHDQLTVLRQWSDEARRHVSVLQQHLERRRLDVVYR